MPLFACACAYICLYSIYTCVLVSLVDLYARMAFPQIQQQKPRCQHFLSRKRPANIYSPGVMCPQALSHLCGIFRLRFVHVKEKSSSNTRVSHQVPEGSVLGLIFFTLYILPFVNIIRHHDIYFHQYADNAQVFVFMKAD